MLTFKQFVIETNNQNVFYHVTTNHFGRFRPFSHFGTKNTARDFALKKNKIEGNKKPYNLHAVRLNLGNSVEIEDNGVEHDPRHINNALLVKGHISREDYKNNENKFLEIEKRFYKRAKPFIKDRKGKHHERRYGMIQNRQYAHLSRFLRSKGIHSISYENSVEGPGEISHMITHPSQVSRIKYSRKARIKGIK